MQQTTTTSSSPIFLGFSSQKGGVGKSTLAEIISSILYYEKGIPLFVMDCDTTQDSFFKLREREKQAIEESAELSTQMLAYFNKMGRRSYRILKADPKSAVARAEAYIRGKPDERFQLVVFDFPGHAQTREMLELSLEMDYIVSPIEADIQSLVSCIAYAKSIQDLGVSMQTARIKDLMLLWNKVDRRTRYTLIEYYSRYIHEQGLSLMQQHIYAAYRFTHELSMYGLKNVFRSTYLPPVKALRAGTGLDELIVELLDILQLKTVEYHGND